MLRLSASRQLAKCPSRQAGVRRGTKAARCDARPEAHPLRQLRLALVSSRPLQLAHLLVILALEDAAFSGDWSRIGAISPQLEEQLQPLAVAALVASAALGTAAALKMAKAGRPAIVPGLKVALFGLLSYEHETGELVGEPGPPLIEALRGVLSTSSSEQE